VGGEVSMGSKIMIDTDAVNEASVSLYQDSTEQLNMIRSYRSKVREMTASMKGASKDSLDFACNNICRQVEDEAGRMSAEAVLLRHIIENRLLIDRELSDSALIDILGQIGTAMTMNVSGLGEFIQNAFGITYERFKEYLYGGDEKESASGSGEEGGSASDNDQPQDKEDKENKEKTPGEPLYQKGSRDSGDDHSIRDIQKILKEHGYDIGSSGADGDYGWATTLAVKRFQEANGLPATGIVDQQTLDLLNSGQIINYKCPIDMDYIHENYNLSEDQYRAIENLYNDNTMGLSSDKKASMMVAAAAMYADGKDDAFVAGVLANIQNEGNAGQFQGISSGKVWRHRTPGGSWVYETCDYPYTGANMETVGYSAARAYADEVDRQMDEYKQQHPDETVECVYGQGQVQWTSRDRRNGLLDAYEKGLDGNEYPTQEQCIRIESDYEVSEINEYGIPETWEKACNDEHKPQYH
jgi:peptidoglycan hydrolase-like protein with peptidoglycan-binding domain